MKRLSVTRAKNDYSHDAIDRLMRGRGGLPSLPEPPPLHKMAALTADNHHQDDEGEHRG